MAALFVGGASLISGIFWKEKTNRMSNPSLKIITAFDEHYQSIGDLSSQSIKKYASAHGFDCEILPALDTGRPQAWSKIFHLIETLEQKTHDFTLWVDADAYFVRTDRSILDEVTSNKHFYVVNHLCRIGTLRGAPGLHIQVERPNLGVILVKNCGWSLLFLKQILDQVEFINHPWWDNAAFNSLLGFHFELSDRQRPNNFNWEIYNYIGWLNGIWNSVPTTANGHGDGLPIILNPSNPAIVHFAGMSLSEKLTAMRALHEKCAN